MHAPPGPWSIIQRPGETPTFSRVTIRRLLKPFLNQRKDDLAASISMGGHYLDGVSLRTTNAMAKAMRAPIKPAGIPKIAM